MSAKKSGFAAAKAAAGTSRVAKLIEEGSALAEDLVPFSTRIPASMKKRMKQLTVDQDSSAQALTIEALEMLFSKYGIK